MKKLICLAICAILVFTLSSCGGETQKNSITLDNGNITVSAPAAASGSFVERGGNDEVKDVAAITVKNNTDRMLEYGKIMFHVNEAEYAEFNISALPAGESAIVMESLARKFSSDDTYTAAGEKSYFSYCDAKTEADGIEVSTNGSEMTVKNNTEAAVDVTIIYKNYIEKNGVYFGGIAYRGSFGTVAAGESVNKTSDRFNDNCRIVNIQTTKSENGGKMNE